ncbi:MAG: DUF3153 domain-containing protein [Prochloraceae cyanobacterium]
MDRKQFQSRSTNHNQGFLLLLPFVLTILVFLGGCVNYDVGINFQGQHRGTIVQRIELKDQLIDLSPEVTRAWLSSIEERSQALQGKTELLSPREVLITVPFNNGNELADKFNSLFNPNSQSISQLSKVEQPASEQLYGGISLNQSNFFLLERDRLNLALDLRSFNLLSQPENNLIVDPKSSVDLQLILNTPLGAKNVVDKNSLIPQVLDEGHQLIWQLEPGKINRIEAVFWIPSTLGIGSVVILFLVLLGFYIQYRAFPWTFEPALSDRR